MLLNLALSGEGYNNYTNMKASGESDFLDLIKEHLTEGICLDIGANMGSYTALLLERGAQNVHCFEPHTDLCGVMEERFKKDAERVQIHSMAIGEEEGRKLFHYNPDALSHSSIIEEINELYYVRNLSSKMIEATSIDRHLGRLPNSIIPIVKIDVEGYELEAIKGASETIERRRPKFIQIEFNQHQLLRGGSILEFSKLLPGYECFQMTPRGLVERDPFDPLSNIFFYSNFVFAREDLSHVLL